MKVLLLILMLSCYVLGQSHSHLNIVNPKKGHFRWSSALSIIQSDLDEIDLTQLLSRHGLSFGIKSNLTVKLNTLFSSSWTNYPISSGYKTEYHSRFHLLTLGLSKNISTAEKDYGVLFSIKTPLLNRQFFYLDDSLTLEEEYFNYIQYGFSFYKLSPPLVPTIRFSQKMFNDTNDYQPGNELNLNFNINFSVTDDWTLLWGAAFTNKRKSVLFNQINEPEQNNIFFNYGILYDISQKLTFKLGCSFSFSHEDTSILSFRSTYRL